MTNLALYNCNYIITILRGKNNVLCISGQKAHYLILEMVEIEIILYLQISNKKQRVQ